MTPLPLLDERDFQLVISYSLSGEEEMSEGIVNAFNAANIDVFDKPTQLVDWINADVFDELRWSAGGPLYLSTLIWDHQVVITAEEIRIYTRSGQRKQAIGDNMQFSEPHFIR